MLQTVMHWYFLLSAVLSLAAAAVLHLRALGRENSARLQELQERSAAMEYRTRSFNGLFQLV